MNRVTLLLIQTLFLSSVIGAEVKVLVNHIGYELSGPKRAVIRGEAGDEALEWKLIDASGNIRLQGEPVYTGAVDRWKNWIFWSVDFEPLRRAGEYRIDCRTSKGSVSSFTFLVEENILERQTLSNVLYYFKGQRCSGLLDMADRSLPFEGNSPGAVDMHGGWYDATGDYGKHLSHLSFSSYHNPQQLSWTVYALWLILEELEGRDDPSFRQYLRRLIDEALFGSDYLVRCKSPAGSFYRSVTAPGPGKKPEDRRVAFEARRFAIKTDADKEELPGSEKKEKTGTYEAGIRAGGGIAVAALAAASRRGITGDFVPAEYLKAAEEAFSWLLKHNLELTNDGRENIVDDYCALCAAVELFLSTKKDEYREQARIRARNLTGRLSGDENYKNYWRADDKDRPFFHAADAGFPVVALCRYLQIAEDSEKTGIRAVLKKYFSFELEISREVTNPFLYARQYVQNKKGERHASFFYPHDSDTAPWWQGENARLGSIAAAARLAGRLFGDEKEFQAGLNEHAASQLNWILGLNPFDACMLHGSGRNNPFYLFFGSIEYTNAPGGICNGITSGFRDDHDIDFNIPHTETGADNDWRWGEQWLPHATWYLYAISIR